MTNLPDGMSFWDTPGSTPLDELDDALSNALDGAECPHLCIHGEEGGDRCEAAFVAHAQRQDDALGVGLVACRDRFCLCYIAPCPFPGKAVECGKCRADMAEGWEEARHPDI